MWHDEFWVGEWREPADEVRGTWWGQTGKGLLHWAEGLSLSQLSEREC